MKTLKITNKENQKGTILETFGFGVYIPKWVKQLSVLLVGISTPIIPIPALPLVLKKQQGGWVRW